MSQSAAKVQATQQVSGLEFATCSHVGLKRNINQDSFAMRLADSPAAFQSKGHLFVVADGMGAHAAGELASRLAVDEVETAEVGESYAKSLIAHFQRANTIIHEQGQANPQLYNMGTTCSALWLLPTGAMIGHVGDSRVYRLRGDRLEQLTFDHSLVWEMRAAGQYSADNANTIPRNVITRCLGPHPRVDVDLEGPFSIRSGDSFLLCSDGLTGKIEDAELALAMRYLPTVDAAEFLVDLANLRGGHDNITATIVQVKDPTLAVEGMAEPVPAVKPGTHPGLWLLAGVGMLAAVAGGAANSPATVAIGGCFCVISGLAILIQWTKSKRVKLDSGMPEPPYAIARTEPLTRLLEQLLETMQQACPPESGESLEDLSAMLATEVDDPQTTLKKIRQLAQRIRRDVHSSH